MIAILYQVSAEHLNNMLFLGRPEGPQKTIPAEDDAIVSAAREQPLTNTKVIH